MCALCSEGLKNIKHKTKLWDINAQIMLQEKIHVGHFYKI